MYADEKVFKAGKHSQASKNPLTSNMASSCGSTSASGASALADLAGLLPVGAVEAKVREWLAEDIPSFDYGGYVVGDKEEEAVLLGKADGVLAGVPFFDAVFREVGCTVQWNLPEGSSFRPVVEVPLHITELLCLCVIIW